jgi:hypothetical protein
MIWHSWQMLASKLWEEKKRKKGKESWQHQPNQMLPSVGFIRQQVIVKHGKYIN